MRPNKREEAPFHDRETGESNVPRRNASGAFDPSEAAESATRFDSQTLAELIAGGLANEEGTCTVEQARRLALAELIIDAYLEWKER